PKGIHGVIFRRGDEQPVAERNPAQLGAGIRILPVAAVGGGKHYVVTNRDESARSEGDAAQLVRRVTLLNLPIPAIGGSKKSAVDPHRHVKIVAVTEIDQVVRLGKG